MKEMSNMNGNDPNRLLSECRDIDRAVDDLEQDLVRLGGIQERHASAANAHETAESLEQVENFSAATIRKYRGLTTRVQKLRGRPRFWQPTKCSSSWQGQEKITDHHQQVPATR